MYCRHAAGMYSPQRDAGMGSDHDSLEPLLVSLELHGHLITCLDDLLSLIDYTTPGPISTTAFRILTMFRLCMVRRGDLICNDYVCCAAPSGHSMMCDPEWLCPNCIYTLDEIMEFLLNRRETPSDRTPQELDPEPVPLSDYWVDYARVEWQGDEDQDPPEYELPPEYSTVPPLYSYQDPLLTNGFGSVMYLYIIEEEPEEVEPLMFEDMKKACSTLKEVGDQAHQILPQVHQAVDGITALTSELAKTSNQATNLFDAAALTIPKMEHAMSSISDAAASATGVLNGIDAIISPLANAINSSQAWVVNILKQMSETDWNDPEAVGNTLQKLGEHTIVDVLAFVARSAYQIQRGDSCRQVIVSLFTEILGIFTQMRACARVGMEIALDAFFRVCGFFLRSDEGTSSMSDNTVEPLVGNPENYGFMNFLADVLAVPRFGAKVCGSLFKGLHDVIKPIANLSKDALSIVALVTALYKFLTWVYEAILQHTPIGWIFKDNEVQEFFQLLTFLEANRSVLEQNISVRKILCEQRSTYIGLRTKITDPSCKVFNSSQTSLIVSFLKKYEELEKYIGDLGGYSSSVYRFDPYCLWVEGAPGTGKSAFAVALLGKLREWDSAEFGGDDATWTPSHRANFDNNYRGQPYVVFDDFQQDQSSSKCNQDYMSLFDFCTPNTTPMNLPHLDDKHRKFTSKFVYVAANFHDPTNAQVMDKDGIRRRRRLVVSMRPKMEFGKPKERSGPMQFDHCEFDILNRMTGAVERTVSLDELYEIVRKDWFRHKAMQMDNIYAVAKTMGFSDAIPDLKTLKSVYQEWFPVAKKDEEPEPEVVREYREADFAMRYDCTSETMELLRTTTTVQMTSMEAIWEKIRATVVPQWPSFVPKWASANWKLILGTLGSIVSLVGVYKGLKWLCKPMKVSGCSGVDKNIRRQEVEMKIRRINEAGEPKFAFSGRGSGDGKLKVRNRQNGRIYDADSLLTKVERLTSVEAVEACAPLNDTLQMLSKNMWSFINENGQRMITGHHIIGNFIMVNMHFARAYSGHKFIIENGKKQRYNVLMHSELCYQIGKTDMCLFDACAVGAATSTYLNSLPTERELETRGVHYDALAWSQVNERTHCTPLTAKLRADWTVVSNDHTYTYARYWVASSVLYEKGDCGTALVSRVPSMDRRVLGFLTSASASRNETYFVAISREALQKAAEEFSYLLGREGELVTAAEIPPLDLTEPLCLHPNLEFIGHVSPQDARFATRKHDLKESPCFGEIFPATKGLSVLSKNDKRVEVPIDGEILTEALKKFTLETKPIPPPQAEMALQVVMAEMGNLRDPFLDMPRVWTEDEAINGLFYPGGQGRVHQAPPMNMDTSAGFPYKRPPGAEPGKKFLFSRRDHPLIPGCPLYTVSDPRLRTELDQAYEQLEKGVVPFMVWTNCLKSEKRPLEKVKTASTRLFTAAPTAAVILFRRYFGSYCAAVRAGAPRGGLAKVGMDATGIDWHNMIMDLLDCGTRGFAIDYSSWDARVTEQMFRIFCTAVNAWYGDSLENRRARWALCDMACHTYTLCGRTVIQKHQGNNSGSPITTELNCVANLSCNVAAAYDLFGPEKAANFLVDFGSVFYGDDFVITCDIEDPELPAKWKAALEAYGHSVTDAEKSNKTPAWKDVSDLLFLKRRTHLLETGIENYFVSALDKESIEQQLNFISVNHAITDRDLLIQNMNGALREAFRHGQEYYEHFVRKLRSWCAEHDYPATFPTFNSYRTLFIEELRQSVCRPFAASPQ